jgi:hypothetical protein
MLDRTESSLRQTRQLRGKSTRQSSRPYAQGLTPTAELRTPPKSSSRSSSRRPANVRIQPYRPALQLRRFRMGRLVVGIRRRPPGRGFSVFASLAEPDISRAGVWEFLRDVDSRARSDRKNFEPAILIALSERSADLCFLRFAQRFPTTPFNFHIVSSDTWCFSRTQNVLATRVSRPSLSKRR